MTYLSIIEKLKILFETLLDFKFILVFSILVLIFTLLYIMRKFSGKKYILYMTLAFIVVFGISIISNYEVLANTFDDFTTILFGNIYFPSIYVYIGVLVIGFIAFLTSMLNVMLKKIYKIINSILFIVNNMLLVVILNIIAKNKIDIFSVNSLYSDTRLVAILELSMGLFILWILSLVTVYVTNCICERITYKKTYNAEVEEKPIFNPVLEVNAPIGDLVNINNQSDTTLAENISSNEIIQSNTFIENNYATMNDNTSTRASSLDIDKQDNSNDFSILFNSILNGNMPVTYYDNNVKEKEYKLADPQSIYEKKYYGINNEKNISTNDIYKKQELSLEEKTLQEKEKVRAERLTSNTISLNDLIDDEVIYNDKLDAVKMINNINALEEKKKAGYTVDDYKKIVKMLKALKIHSNSTNINIDDAVAISLISNYSIDDCMKFRNILESNLN